MWALIVDGRVSEITDIDPDGRFHPSLQWVKCKSDTAPSMVYQGGKFSAYVEPVPAYTAQQVEAMRLRAYADPLSGSDRYFAEAMRLQAMGAESEKIDAANALGAARFAEIQSQNPWPED